MPTGSTSTATPPSSPSVSPAASANARCHQRAVPPLERRLTVNPDHRGTLPYDIAD
jgi:predicted transcriptional regulator